MLACACARLWKRHPRPHPQLLWRPCWPGSWGGWARLTAACTSRTAPRTHGSCRFYSLECRLTMAPGVGPGGDHVPGGRAAGLGSRAARAAQPRALVFKWVAGTHLRLHHAPGSLIRKHMTTSGCHNWGGGGGGAVLASEAEGTTQCPTRHGQHPQQRVVRPKTSTGPRARPWPRMEGLQQPESWAKTPGFSHRPRPSTAHTRREGSAVVSYGPRAPTGDGHAHHEGREGDVSSELQVAQVPSQVIQCLHV